jgi:hypothetical protein
MSIISKSYLNFILQKEDIEKLDISSLLKYKNIILIQDTFRENKELTTYQGIKGLKTYQEINMEIQKNHGGLILLDLYLKNKEIKKEQVMKLSIPRLNFFYSIKQQDRCEYVIYENKVYLIEDILNKINKDNKKHNILINNSFIVLDGDNYLNYDKYLINKYNNLIISKALYNSTNTKEEKNKTIEIFNKIKPIDRIVLGCDNESNLYIDNEKYDNKIITNWDMKCMANSSSVSTILYGYEKLKELNIIYN